MGHHHHHHHHHCSSEEGKESSLLWAIFVNLLLTLVQVVAAFFSGGLSLMADALHNFSDAGSLIIAYLSHKIAGRPADHKMTFGYGRARIIGALINSLSLIFVGVYLIYEAWSRFQNPQEVEPWTLIFVASLALVIDLFTAWLVFRNSENDINMRAAFIHNLTDAAASVVVIFSGICILIFENPIFDLIATLIISIYIIYLSFGLIKSCLSILMQAAPEDLSTEEIMQRILKIHKVINIQQVHLWEINENFRSFEAHILVKALDLKEAQLIKKEIKETLLQEFAIKHSTLEFEFQSQDCKGKEEHSG